jgi:hypothetical protein
MAGTTLEALNNILRDVYMGAPVIKAVPVQVWTCSKHRRPVLDQYEEVCLAAEALGEVCEDMYECPHVISRKVKDGCAECKTSRFADVLDYETVWMDESGFVGGDTVHVAKLMTTMQWELSQPSILLRVMEGSKLPPSEAAKVVLPLHIKWKEDGD